MFLDKIDMLVLEELSKNSRCHLKDIAQRADCSIQTISNRLERLEKELRLHYTIELNLEKTGYANEFLARVKFKDGKKPDPHLLRETLNSNPLIQFAASTKGDFDLLIWSLASSPAQYERDVEAKIRMPLDDFIDEWDAHPVLVRRAGFLPVTNDFIDLLDIPSQKKKVLKILNDDSRIMLIHLAEQLGVTEPTAEYHLKRVAPYVRRFTTYFEGRGEFINMARFFQVRGKPEDFQTSGRKVTHLYLRNEPRLFNRLVYATSPTGGMDTFLLETFTSLEDIAEHTTNLRSHSTVIGKHAVSQIQRVLKGNIPIRKVDLASTCRFLLSPAELSLDEQEELLGPPKVPEATILKALH